MADINSTTSAASIADDILTAITPSYQVEALLRGALKLLEDHTFDDPEILAAVNIIETAFDSVKEIYTQYDELNIGNRITALSAGKPEPTRSATVHILAEDLGRAHRSIRRLHRKIKRAIAVSNELEVSHG